MGYRLDPGQPDVTVNGFTHLTPINLESLALSASATTAGSFVANLPADTAALLPTVLPSLNGAGSQFTAKSSLITYNNLGGEVRLDIYFTKIGDEEWEMTVFDASLAGPGSQFPYSAGPLSSETLLFDSTTGSILAGQPVSVDIPIPDGQTLALAIGGLSQLSTSYVVISAGANGNPPSGADVVEIASDGLVYATYENGTRIPVYRIPLAHVTSPDMLTPLAGNVFMTSSESGDVIIGFAQTGGLGDIISSALEQSTVDLASELTSMIDAQRSYTANSKVFQTGSELMEVLVNLKR